MSNKSYQNNLFKRIIDLGRVTTADVDDLVRIWRVGSGDEKAITLANFVATVDADLGSGGSSLTELIEALQNQVDNLTFLDLTDTPASYTGQAGLFPRVNSGESALEFFNPLSLPLTGYTVGSNTALADTDTILGAFGKVQGQINAKIGGTIASGQVAFGTASNTIGGDSGLTWDNSTKQLSVGSVANSIAIATIGSIRARSRSDSFQNGYLQIRHNASDVFDAGFVLESVKNGISNTRVDVGADSIVFYTNSIGSSIIQRWRINGSGDLESTDGKAIRTTNNGNLLLIPNGTGNVSIKGSSASETLDVNGTARIRTLSNATGDFVTASATGVLQKRTAAEVVSDLGISPSSYQREKFIYSASNVFTITHNAPNAVMVFLNGQKLEFTDDWTISGTSVTVNTPLVSEDEISIEYFYQSPILPLNNYTNDINPVFYYNYEGMVSQINYSNGNYKVFSYTDGILTQLDYVTSSATIRKTFTYNVDGTLQSITQNTL